MLSGNPNTFAIWCDAVDSWSTEQFKNGCMGYFLGGKLIWSLRSTLGVDLSMLGDRYCMKNSLVDDELFSLPVDAAYKRLCDRAFPLMDSDTESSDFRHLVSVESLSDERRYVFLVESSDKAKLIFGLGQGDLGAAEVILRRGEFQKVAISALSKFTGGAKGKAD